MVFIKSALVFAAAVLFFVACATSSDEDAARGSRSNANRPNANRTSANRTSAAPAASTTSVAVAPELASARSLYKQNCAACHGTNGQGNLAWKVPSLKEGVAATHSEEQLARQIAAGGNGMPPYKDSLSEEQRANLVRLIRQEFQGKGKTD